jgi:hypothetical protein
MNVRTTAVATALVLVVAAGVPATSGATSQNAAYAAAKHTWKVTLCKAAYQQGGLWRRATGDLDGARPRPHSYHVAAGWLRAIANLPETSDTPAQMRLFSKDAHRLDHFFHTPGLYVKYTGQCPG